MQDRSQLRTASKNNAKYINKIKWQYFILIVPFKYSVDSKYVCNIRVLVDCLLIICQLFIEMLLQQTLY